MYIYIHTHTHIKFLKFKCILTTLHFYTPNAVLLMSCLIFWVLPGGSDSRESAGNSGDPGWIPGLGRSPGEGNGYPLHYSCLENSISFCFVYPLITYFRYTQFYYLCPLPSLLTLHTANLLPLFCICLY